MSSSTFDFFRFYAQNKIQCIQNKRKRSNFFNPSSFFNFVVLFCARKSQLIILTRNKKYITLHATTIFVIKEICNYYCIRMYWFNIRKWVYLYFTYSTLLTKNTNIISGSIRRVLPSLCTIWYVDKYAQPEPISI